MRLRHFPWLVGLLFLTACETAIQERGNILNPKEVDRIRIGRTTQKEVRDLLGSPTLVNLYRKERWLYVQDRRFKGTRAVNRLEITFDRNGTVQDLRRNFQSDLMDPTTLAAEQKPSWWETVMRRGPEIGLPAGHHDPNIPKRIASRVDEKNPSFWEKFLDFSIRHQEPPPAVSFKQQEAGWWKNIWSRDPTRTNNSQLTEDEIAHMSGDEFYRPDTPASAPTDQDKPWWRFWSSE